MPPKGKGKKGNHPPPEESRQVVRRREQEKKKDAKKLAIALKNLKKEQKLKKSGSSTSCDKDTQQFLQRQQGNESDIEDISQPQSSSREPSTSCTTGQRTDIQSESSKKTGNVCTPTKGMSLINQKGSEENAPKNVTESKKLGRNIDETEQLSSQSIPLDSSVRKKMPQGEQVKTQVETKKKRNVKKRCKKLAKCVDSVSNAPTNAPSKVQKKTLEDESKDRNEISKENLEDVQTSAIFSNDKMESILPYFKEKETAIKGVIQVILEEDKICKKSDTKISVYSFYFEDKILICIGDEDIKISIFVNQGNQVVCNSRRRYEIGLNQSGRSCSDPLEGHAATRQEEDIKIDSEKCDEMISETKCDSYCVEEFSNGNCQTVDDQSTGNLGTCCLQDSEKHETADDTTGNFSKENDSSGTLSVREKMHKVCNEYLRDLHSTCETFKTSVQNQIKGDSLKSTEI